MVLMRQLKFLFYHMSKWKKSVEHPPINHIAHERSQRVRFWNILLTIASLKASPQYRTFVYLRIVSLRSRGQRSDRFPFVREAPKTCVALNTKRSPTKTSTKNLVCRRLFTARCPLSQFVFVRREGRRVVDHGWSPWVVQLASAFSLVASAFETRIQAGRKGRPTV